MYQRLVILSSLDPPGRVRVQPFEMRLPTQLQDELDHLRYDHVGEQEEHRRQRHHHQDHRRRDPHLFPGGPRDFRCFLAHFVDELERVLHLQPMILDKPPDL